jgi:hypothetical protein
MPDLAASFLQRAEKCRQNEDAATCAQDKADWITLDRRTGSIERCGRPDATAWMKLRFWWQTRAMRGGYRRLFQRRRPRKRAF